MESFDLSLLGSVLLRPDVASALSVNSLVLLTRLLHSLRDHIRWSCGAGLVGPPADLPHDVQAFLADVLGLDLVIHYEVIPACWKALRQSIWQSGGSLSDGWRSKDLIDVFAKHGPQHKLHFYNFYPPTRTCLDQQCSVRHQHTPRALAHLQDTCCVVFSHSFGPVLGRSYAATCRGCGSRYYPTYYVDNKACTRTYYPASFAPQHFIHVTTHSYVESFLCELFTGSMVAAAVSATNNAQIYNRLFSDIDEQDPAWPVSPRLSMAIVWDAFFLSASLKECEECQQLLAVPSNVDQDSRIEQALRWRNKQMVGPGQENWGHICSLCCEMTESDGQTYIQRAVVTDGTAVGRPCCNVHDCQGVLPTVKHRFCTEHADLVNQCAVIDCALSVEVGFKTCTIESHRSAEEAAHEHHTALFKLSKQLGVSTTGGQQDLGQVDSVVLDSDGQSVPLPRLDANSVECEPKPAEGNFSPRARFGRRRTHNEQLCVATCGVILGRATFYGSEAVNGVRIFLKRLFPTKASLPQYIFFDNACTLKKHLDAVEDHHFDQCALPVDVFHMKSKHKDTDEFCKTYCNPARFKDLIKDGRWRFNSSAAEMTNAWFGNFSSIAREMRQERYEFFLDEMIKQRNRIIVQDLLRRRLKPLTIPRSAYGIS